MSLSTLHIAATILGLSDAFPFVPKGIHRTNPAGLGLLQDHRRVVVFVWIGKRIVIRKAVGFRFLHRRYRRLWRNGRRGAGVWFRGNGSHGGLPSY